MSQFIRVVRAYEGETVEIQWRLEGGAIYVQRVTIPPKATRDAQQWAEQQVQARRQSALGIEEIPKP